MGSALVLREIDLKNPVDDLAVYGAISSGEMETTWRALESIRLIATILPAYHSGCYPLEEGRAAMLKHATVCNPKSVGSSTRRST